MSRESESRRKWMTAMLALILSRVAACSPSRTCEITLDTYVQQQGSTIAGPPNSSHMLFFLHVPRTAGRTFHSCFLKTATPPSRRCEKSYDVLRLNASISSCGLLSSHDDMSITDNLPPDTAFVTQLRCGPWAFINLCQSVRWATGTDMVADCSWL